MTKELKLEECVNLLSGTVSSVSGGASTSSTAGAYRQHTQKSHNNRRQIKPTSLLPPTSPYVSGNSGTSPPKPLQPHQHHHQQQQQHSPLQPPPQPQQQQHQSPPPPPTSLQHNSTFAGQSLITSTPKAMIRRSSKNELRGGCQCTIRLLDDAEILQCDFLVSWDFLRKLTNNALCESIVIIVIASYFIASFQFL